MAPPGISKVRELAVDALPGISKVREFAVDAPPGISKVRELAVDAPPAISKVRELAVDALPGISKVREFAGVHNGFTIMYPWTQPTTPTRPNPVTCAPAPPPSYSGIVELRISV
jgi:hypothetical protein